MSTVHKNVFASIVGLIVLTIISAIGIGHQSAPTVHVTVIGAAVAPEVQATVYSADWCGHCRPYIASINREMPKDGWIVRDSTDKDSRLAHVVINKDPKSIDEFKIEALPCTILRKNGKPEKPIYGAMTPDELVKRINDLAKKETR